ncbi:MAG: envZ 2 [Alphaproteobacteria bacterium]|nr:envZ 2 [Alphaproteobacteria bacterium]
MCCMSINRTLINRLRWTWLRLLRFWQRTLPQTLFGRSMLILVTPVVLTLGIGLFVFFDRHWSTTTTNLTSSLAGEIALIADGWEREKTPENHRRLIGLASSKLGFQVYFSFLEKLPVLHDHNIPAAGSVNDTLEHALRQKSDYLFSIHSVDGNTPMIIVNVAVSDGLLKFHVPRKRLFSTTTYVFLLFTIGSGLILSIIAVIFMRNQIRPVRRLALVAEKFGKGIDVPRYKPAGAREVRQAAMAFMDMQDRIKRQIRQRTDMLSGVSHDLRTPLTRLKLELALLPPDIDTKAMQDDIAAMEKMIKGYLDFARSETLENSASRDLVALLRQSIEMQARQGLKITTRVEADEIMMTVRPHSLQRVFANILQNARLYASEAWVTVTCLSRSVEIVFDDNGPGIAPHLREDAFKPFHRIDASRNQNIEGTGLGLTIARDITQSHGGTITLDASPKGGLRVILSLPL